MQHKHQKMGKLDGISRAMSPDEGGKLLQEGTELRGNILPDRGQIQLNRVKLHAAINHFESQRALEGVICYSQK